MFCHVVTNNINIIDSIIIDSSIINIIGTSIIEAETCIGDMIANVIMCSMIISSMTIIVTSMFALVLQY